MTVLRFLFLLTLLLPVSPIFSQTTLGFRYQAIARDLGGGPLANQPITLQVMIHSSSPTGPLIYLESHSLTTNSAGLFTTVIGEGSTALGTWSQLDWSDNDLYMEVMINGYQAALDRLEAVPFAKMATQMRVQDLIDVSAQAPQIDQVLKWNGSEWIPAADVEGPTYLAGAGISISGTSIINTMPDKVVSITGAGATTITGSYPSFTISSTDNVNDADANPTNEIQTLSISGTDLTLSKGGGSVILPQLVYFGGPGISVTGTVINNTGDINAADDITTSTAASGDLSGTYPNPSVFKIRGVPVGATTPTANQVLTFLGNTWVPANPPLSPWTKVGSTVSYMDGNAGIGLTAPMDKLHVHTNSSAAASMRITNTTTGSTSSDGFWLGYSGSNAAYVYNYESTPIIFGTSNAEKMRLSPSGDLGVGTITPSGKVEISHNGSATYPQLQLYENATTDFARIRFQNASGSTYWTLGGKTATSLASAAFSLSHSSGGTLIHVRPDGKIGLLTDNPAGDLHLKQTTTFWASGGGLIFEENGSSTDTWQMLHSGLHFSFVENATRRAYIEAGTGNWVQPSDARLKQDVVEVDSVLDRLMNLRPVRYHYLGQEGADLTLGFLAQEVVAQFPELKHVSEDGYLGLAYRDFGILAVKAIQEQQQQIEQQAALVENLQKRVAQQQEELDAIKAMLAEITGAE